MALGLLLLMAACKEAQKPVTKEQAMQFADALGKSIYKKDKSFFNDAFDTDEMINKMKALEPGKKAAFWRDAKKGLSGQADFGQKIILAQGKDGSYSLVKQYEKEGKQHVIFRHFADDGLNYHDYELINKGGRTKIADIYIYTTGEAFSKTMLDLFQRLDGIDTDDMSSMASISKFEDVKGLVAKGKYQEAKDIIDDLPAKIRNSKAVQLTLIQICSSLDNQLYNEALEKFARDFPNDPSLSLNSIDRYFLAKEYDKALGSIDQLDKQINTDPFLDYYRGLVYKTQGKQANALQAMERLYKNLPTFSSGGVELATYYMDAGQYEKAVGILKKVKQNKDYNEGTFGNIYLLYPKLKPLMGE
jgi:hypothetical protein